MDSRLAHWIALLVFAILIVGWVLAAVYLTGASARRPGFPYNFSSKLAANYAADGGEKISSLRISIVADLLRDLGIPVEQASILDELDSPVPTATARNFSGDPPLAVFVASNPHAGSDRDPRSIRGRAVVDRGRH